MRISIIVAMARNRVIGKNNQLPWRLPEDLKRFKALTLGHPVVMGRKTFESIGKPLPGRRNIVLTRDSQFKADGMECLSSIDEALKTCSTADEVFVMGGGEIYRQTLPRADRIYLTLIHDDIQGDAYFPEWNVEEFKEVSREDRTDSKSSTPFSFLTLDRVS